ncbi:MAG: hypothetical protein R2855_13980 [Thermomicrobiales bacterium]
MHRATDHWRHLGSTLGNEWIERIYIPIFPPSEWGATYDGARDFQLGRRVGRRRRGAVITFYVTRSRTRRLQPGMRWIDEETGHLVNETMVSRLHYMRWRFFDFDAPVDIPVPGTVATPVASPQASPVASPAASAGDGPIPGLNSSS